MGLDLRPMGKPKPGFEKKFTDIFEMISQDKIPKPSLFDKLKGKKIPSKEELFQARTYSPVKERLIGLECTVTVENVDEIVKRVQNSGQILIPKTAIPYVGWITKFLDTEGNLVCAMQSDSSAKG